MPSTVVAAAAPAPDHRIFLADRDLFGYLH